MWLDEAATAAKSRCWTLCSHAFKKSDTSWTMHELVILHGRTGIACPCHLLVSTTSFQQVDQVQPCETHTVVAMCCKVMTSLWPCLLYCVQIFVYFVRRTLKRLRMKPYSQFVWMLSIKTWRMFEQGWKTLVHIWYPIRTAVRTNVIPVRKGDANQSGTQKRTRSVL